MPNTIQLVPARRWRPSPIRAASPPFCRPRPQRRYVQHPGDSNRPVPIVTGPQDAPAQPKLDNDRYLTISNILSNPDKVSRTRQVRVSGIVQTIRNQKHQSFAKLGDGSTMQEVQALLRPEQAQGISTGTFMLITGYWKPSPGADQPYELHAEKVNYVGPVDAATYPLQKKYHTPEFLRTIPHLRLRSPMQGLITRLRTDLEHWIQNFFYRRDYVRPATPMITSTDCEGTGAVFAVQPRTAVVGVSSPASHSTSDDASTSGAASSPAPYFRTSDGEGGPRFLVSSAQLHLEAYMHTHLGAWTLAPCFRAERSDTPRHLSEFTMLEVELRTTRLRSVMETVRGLLRNLAVALRRSPTGRELLAAGRHGGADEAARADRVRQRLDALALGGTWTAVSYQRALAALRTAVAEGQVSFQHAPTAAGGFGVEHERWLVQKFGNGRPLFVAYYPQALKPFYMRPVTSPLADLPPNTDVPDVGPTVACFDLLLPDLGEVAGGSLREHRLEPLLEVMRARGLYPPAPGNSDGSDDGSGVGDLKENAAAGAHRGGGNGPLDWYVDLRRYGTMPHGGFGLGFDRLVAYLSGVDNLRDVVPWPRYHGRCDG